MLRNNNQLTVGLSNPATRLLNELIKNNKVELTRETLIKHVWEDYGFSPSSATLSNHISELRKAFEVLGVSKNILITVPRIGFKMEAEIHPETKALKEKELAATEKIEMIPPSLELVSEGNTAPPLIDAKSEKTPYRMKKSVLFLTLALVSIATATAFVVLTRDDEPTLVDVQDKCNIYTLDDNKQSTELSDKARKMLIAGMNEGSIRVLFGSTSMLGTGVNAQKRAVAIHLLYGSPPRQRTAQGSFYGSLYQK